MAESKEVYKNLVLVIIEIPRRKLLGKVCLTLALDPEVLTKQQKLLQLKFGLVKPTIHKFRHHHVGRDPFNEVYFNFELMIAGSITPLTYHS